LTPPGGAGAPSPSAPFVEAKGLVREFAGVAAVDGIDLALPAGAFLVIFGPNGAGKTSLLRMLAGGMRPTRGEVWLAIERPDADPGRPPRRERIGPGSAEGRERIGVLSHQTFLYSHLTARENLRFFGRLYGLTDLAERVSQRLEQVGLTTRADDRVQTFSRGMRQRLGLARTLLHDPELVLLDEPYTGLDAHAAAVLRGILEALHDGRRTVVLVTHNITQGLEIADRAAIQVRGRFAWEGSTTDVRPHEFEVFYQDTVDRVEGGLAPAPDRKRA
jgi:ABC-type multidrug transport system ATPase subunit